MTSTALYVLADEYRQLAEQLQNLNLPEEVVRDTLEGAAGALETKATNCAMVVQNLEASAAAIVEAASAMYDRAARIAHRADLLRHYMLHNLQRAGISKVESPYFVMSVKDNPPRVDIFDESMVPDRFMVQPPAPPKRPDKKAMGAAMKAGEEVPGARITQDQRLEIK